MNVPHTPFHSLDSAFIRSPSPLSCKKNSGHHRALPQARGAGFSLCVYHHYPLAHFQLSQGV